jgi:hypothetical protein
MVRNAPRAVTRQGLMPDCGRGVRGVPKGVTAPAAADLRARSAGAARSGQHVARLAPPSPLGMSRPARGAPSAALPGLL